MDYSITRSKKMHKGIFKASGLKIIEIIEQTDFPPNLIPVKLYVLQ